MNDLNWTWSAARKKTHTQTNSEYLIIRRFSFTLSKCSCVRRYSCSSFKCSQSMSYKYLLTLLEACIIHESTPYHIYKHRHCTHMNGWDSNWECQIERIKVLHRRTGDKKQNSLKIIYQKSTYKCLFSASFPIYIIIHCDSTFMVLDIKFS